MTRHTRVLCYAHPATSPQHTTQANTPLDAVRCETTRDVGAQWWFSDANWPQPINRTVALQHRTQHGPLQGLRDVTLRALTTKARNSGSRCVDKIPCVISIGRTHQTLFSVTRSSPVVGTRASRYDVMGESTMAGVAAGLGQDYSNVNFQLLWRLARLVNTMCTAAIAGSGAFALVFKDLMFRNGTRAMAAEVGATLPKLTRGSDLAQLRPFSHIVFARRRRSLQRRSRRRVASLRVGRLLFVNPR